MLTSLSSRWLGDSVEVSCRSVTFASSLHQSATPAAVLEGGEEGMEGGGEGMEGRGGGEGMEGGEKAIKAPHLFLTSSENNCSQGSCPEGHSCHCIPHGSCPEGHSCHCVPQASCPLGDTMALGT